MVKWRGSLFILALLASSALYAGIGQQFAADNSGNMNVIVKGGTFPTPIPNATVTVANFPTMPTPIPVQPVSGSFFQATQPVSGTLTCNAGTGTENVSVQNASIAVTGSFPTPPPTQPVSGTVTISNALPSPIPNSTVTVSNFPATQAVSGTVAISNALPTPIPNASVGISNPSVLPTPIPFPATQAVTESGTWTVQPGNTANTTAWLVTDGANQNTNTTTGDTGAKTTSFSGATQTNSNGRGAIITVLCGTVTGTSPTMSAQLQWNPDGAGTNWLTIGAASGNATATGNTIVFMVYPTNFSVAGATPAALATGGTLTVQLNSVMPKTWRLNYTIGGTSPSFTITAVYVNYLK